MIPRFLAALGAILTALTHMHLTLSVFRLSVTVAVPWVLSAAFVTVLAVMVWIVWRNVHGFRSTPYPRTRAAT